MTLAAAVMPDNASAEEINSRLLSRRSVTLADMDTPCLKVVGCAREIVTAIPIGFPAQDILQPHGPGWRRALAGKRAAGWLSVDHAQAQMLDERLKIPSVVQQVIPALDASGGNYLIHHVVVVFGSSPIHGLRETVRNRERLVA
jgi:hypothetical protein